MWLGGNAMAERSTLLSPCRPEHQLRPGSMRALSNPATFFGHAFMIASKRLAHPNFAGRHLHILWLWDHNCVPKNVMVYHPKKILPKSEVVSTPSCAWCPKPRLPEWIMTCEKGNEHLVLEEIDLRGGKGSP